MKMNPPGLRPARRGAFRQLQQSHADVTECLVKLRRTRSEQI
jgi:hypothetical protein